MATTMVNNLFPPQVETFQPAFIYSTDAVVEFSIPSFNSLKNIRYLHVLVKDQRNNTNALRGSLSEVYREDGYDFTLLNGILIIKFPSVIKDEEELSNDERRTSLITYHKTTNTWKVKIPTYCLRQTNRVLIDPVDNQNIELDFLEAPANTTRYFNIGQYYKVQLRFDCYWKDKENNLSDWGRKIHSADKNSATYETAYTNFNSYLMKKRIYFSEWSEVTLIKPILHVNLSFPKLDGSYIDGAVNKLVDLNQGINGIVAKIIMADRIWYEKHIKEETSEAYSTDAETEEQTEESSTEEDESQENAGSTIVLDNLDYTQGLTGDKEDEYVERFRFTVHPLENIDGVILTDYDTIIYQGDWEYTAPLDSDTNSNYGINSQIMLTEAAKEEFYTLVTEYYTNNNYYGKTERYFQIGRPDDKLKGPFWHDKSNANYDEIPGHIEINNEDGVVKIRLRWNVNDACEDVNYLMSDGVLYIKRASGIDNFKKKDIISVTYHTQDEISKANDCILLDLDDYTVSSLVPYKYYAQYHLLKSAPKGSTSKVIPAIWTPIFDSNIVYPKFYDMLLERQGRQIAIRYNGQVSGWKPVVNRQKVDTLGGRYPKFVENAQMNYTQFSISGLITAEGDFNRTFLNEYDGEFVLDEEGSYIKRNDQYIYEATFQEGDKRYKFIPYYETDINLYNSYMDGKYLMRNDTDADGSYGYNPKLRKNMYDVHSGNLPFEEEEWGNSTAKAIKGYDKSIFYDNRIKTGNHVNYNLHDWYPTENWYWERLFRKELIAWLNDGEPKLYRSMPEGNMAVMLTDINLTPNPQVGRRLYNFSATVYEIGDGNDLEVLDSLGIYTIPKLTNRWGEIITDVTEEDSPESDEAFTSNENAIGQLWLPETYAIDLINGEHIANDPSEYIWNDKTIRELINLKYRGYFSGTKLSTNPIKAIWIRFQYVSLPKYYYYSGNQGVYQWKLVNMKGDKNNNNTDFNMTSYGYGENTLKKKESLEKISKTIDKNRENIGTAIREAVLRLGTNNNSIDTDKTNISLGYLLSLMTDNANVDYKDFFINEKGFYQTPSSVYTKGLKLDPLKSWGTTHKDKVIIDYIVSYQLLTDTSNIPRRKTKVEDVLGQWGGMFPYNKAVYDDIYKKYYYVEYASGNEEFYDWQFTFSSPRYGNEKVNDSTATIIIPNSEDIQVILENNHWKIINNNNHKSTALAERYNFSSPEQAASWLWMLDMTLEKNKSKNNKEYIQELNTWQGISVDVTPYAVLDVKYPDYVFTNTLVVGRSGTLSFIDDNPVREITFKGRRMVQASKSRQPYLDEWEYVLDDLLATKMGIYQEDLQNINWKTWYQNMPLETQVAIALYFNYTIEEMEGRLVYQVDTDLKRQLYPFWFNAYYSSQSDIKKPAYNTVYPFAIDNKTYYYIYYIDDKWYEVIPHLEGSQGSIASSVLIADINQGTIVAKVPVYGYINYRAELLRSYL